MNYRILGTNVFLIGTIHIIPSGTTLSLNTQERLVSSADEVIFESDLENVPLPECHIIESGTLIDIVGKKLYDQVVTIAGSVEFKEPIDQLKPWYLGLTLGVYLQLRSGATFGGVDRHLWDFAKSMEKKRFILDGIEFFRKIDSAPINESINGLQYLVDQPEEPVNQLKSIFNAWKNLDHFGLDKAFIPLARIMPTIYRYLFNERNRLWINSIIKAVSEKRNATFVVGSGHIAHGSDSLRNLLHKNSFEIEQVN